MQKIYINILYRKYKNETFAENYQHHKKKFVYDYITTRYLDIEILNK